MSFIKNISYEIDEIPNGEKVNENGEYVFNLYISNDMEDDDSYLAIRDIVKIWKTGIYAPLRINIRLKEVAENLIEMYATHGVFSKQDQPLFEALRNDCEWIVEQIDKLEVEK